MEEKKVNYIPSLYTKKNFCWKLSRFQQKQTFQILNTSLGFNYNPGGGKKLMIIPIAKSAICILESAPFKVANTHVEFALSQYCIDLINSRGKLY